MKASMPDGRNAMMPQRVLNTGLIPRQHWMPHLLGFLAGAAAADDDVESGLASAVPPADDTRLGFPSAHLH